MDSQTIVSIQVIGASDLKQLECMLYGILSQKHEYLIELNIQKTAGFIALDCLPEKISGQMGNCKVNLYDTSSNDFWGLHCITGKYVAFCCDGDIWSDCKKLEQQIKFLEQNEEFTACVHDVDLVDELGISYNYSSQQIYKQSRYSLNRVYTWHELTKNIYPSAISTLVSRNVFAKCNLDEFNLDADISQELLLYSTIVFNGICYNLYDKQFVKKICSNDKICASIYDAKDRETVTRKIKEMEFLVSLASSRYQLDFETCYRKIILARSYFNYYIQSTKTSDELEFFIKLYDEAHKPEYDCLVKDVPHILEEKLMFDRLKIQVEKYQLNNGTRKELPLLKYSNPATDDIRIEYVLRCYRRPSAANLIWKNILIKEADNSLYVKRIVRYRILSAPFRMVKRRIVQGGKFIHRSFKRWVTYCLRKKGYSPYMANEWYDTVRVNLLTDRSATLWNKIWCYRRGFMPWRLPQYGATKENFRMFLSDRDYMYLHQINNSYKKWIEDKMTLRYVLEPFSKYLPKYYFQIIRREGFPIILPLMDCPSGYEATLDDLFRLLREKGALALKAASGTHGIGFYKLSYSEGNYYLNNGLSSEYEITSIIRSFKSFYIVTEYVKMHESIKRIYDGSVNTIRILMINKDGYHPQLLDSYMRIGTSKSGVTDNIAYGGVTCRVDINTGAYGGGEQLANHQYTSCNRHPDTDTLIEGVVPHWDVIKETLIKLCTYIAQLEYLGFDVVVTPDSFCILEINSHQDLQKFPLYDVQVKKFLFDKLEQKCKYYNIKRI